MRFRSILIAAVISIFVSVGAIGQDLEKKVSVTHSLEPRPHVTITNNYSSKLTGIAIVNSGTIDNRKVIQTIWLDSALNFHHDYPLETNESRSFQVAHFDQGAALSPHLMAVTFEDQTSAGDPELISKFHARRKAAYDEIGAVTALLNQAYVQHQTKDQIIASLNDMHDSLKTNIHEVKTRIAAGLVIDNAVSNLEGPGGAIRDPQQIIPEILLPKFAAWREALKRFDNNIS
jgi:hypothetical protein